MSKSVKINRWMCDAHGNDSPHATAKEWFRSCLCQRQQLRSAPWSVRLVRPVRASETKNPKNEEYTRISDRGQYLALLSVPCQRLEDSANPYVTDLQSLQKCSAGTGMRQMDLVYVAPRYQRPRRSKKGKDYTCIPKLQTDLKLHLLLHKWSPPRWPIVW